MDTPALLTTGQAAQRLGVSLSYLNKLRLGTDGPVFVKLGARVGYDPNDLAAWIEAQKRHTTADNNQAARFPNDAVRSAVVSVRNAAFAVSYLDPAAWDAEARTITARTEIARRKLCELELREIFADLGVTVGDLAAGGL